MPYQLIYSSVSSTPMQLEELEDILEQAHVNNASEDITGALVYVDGFFLQILEGEQAAVEQLMATISRDLRHEMVTVLQSGDIRSRAFADWRMAYVSATPDQVAQWVGLAASTALPQVWDDVRRDRTKVAQVAAGIVALLAGGQASAPLPA